jgi:hypothetical protein
VADWKTLINQWSNEHSVCDELSHHLVFTKNDTAGEVDHAREAGFSLGFHEPKRRDFFVPFL